MYFTLNFANFVGIFGYLFNSFPMFDFNRQSLLDLHNLVQLSSEIIILALIDQFLPFLPFLFLIYFIQCWHFEMNAIE